MSSTHTKDLMAGGLEYGTLLMNGLVCYRLVPVGPSRPYSKRLEEQMFADAKMFAAASDLYAACKAALQELGTLDHACSLGMMETNPAVKQLKAALAKAEGGAE